MAVAKVTIEALTQMANTLRQSADDILLTKEQMDNELHSFPWEDPIGLSFINQYEEDFKPLKEKLIPDIEQYLQYMSQEELIVTEYNSENGGVLGGAGLGIAASFVAPLGKVARFTGIPREPLNVYSSECNALRKTAQDYYNEWAYITENGKRRLRQYNVTYNNQDGTKSKKILTAQNYQEFDKETFVKALSVGMGFRYEERDLGPIRKNGNGVISGKLGYYDPKRDVISINRNVFSSDFVKHDDIVEIVFHENQHRNQKIRMDSKCLDFVPRYVSVGDACVTEITKAEQEKDISERCMNQYIDYTNQWSEKEATEVGTGARRIFTKNRR